MKTNFSLTFFRFLGFWVIVVLGMISSSGQVSKEWLTPAEKTDYRTTPSYDETLAFLKRLDAASPLITLSSFGKSGEGRDLLLIVAAKDNAFTPEAARRQGKAVVLIQACIHAGESDGKDAGMALLRDIAISKTRLNLLDKTVIVFEPIYNADGHENFSPYKRINQNGPEAMGFRANALNLNLNRDYIKAEAPETRAWLALWNRWQPDLFIDCHVTNGADYRYNVTYQFERHQNTAPVIKDWLENIWEKKVVPQIEANGNLLSRYMEFRDNRDLTKGIDEFLSTPRYATGYVPMRNRPAILIETHMLKPHKSRVTGTYDLLRFTLEEVNRDPQTLIAAGKQADAETIKNFQSYNASAQFPLRLSLSEQATPYRLKAVEYKTEKSEISGDTRVIFGDKPLDITVPFYDQAQVAVGVATPVAYIVPPQWKEAIERLELHGLKLERLAKPQRFAYETYRLNKPKWAGAPFEGRLMLSSFEMDAIKAESEFPAGSIIVRLNQPAAKVAVHLLEPRAPDSLVAWGFFNAIFEQKEGAENYKLEKLAAEMLAKDENLRREFERKLKEDQAFANNPRARLNFFYERSPYFTEQKVGLYPVGRILDLNQ